MKIALQHVNTFVEPRKKKNSFTCVAPRHGQQIFGMAWVGAILRAEAKCLVGRAHVARLELVWLVAGFVGSMFKRLQRGSKIRSRATNTIKQAKNNNA